MIKNKLVMSLFLISSLFFKHNVEAEEITFSDVSSNHWAIDDIRWGVENDIIDGYPDGTFKPEKTIGQTEFISMLIRAYKPIDFEKSNEDTDWFKPYMHYAFDNGWGSSIVVPPPTSGVHSFSDVGMNRFRAAKLITNTYGRNYNQTDSVQFLLDINIVQGKSNKSLQGYSGNDSLTRAEALKLIRNVKSNLDILYCSPQNETSYNPNSVKTSPAENFLLEVSQPPEFSLSFSQITFDNPKYGYEKIKTNNFNLKGSVLQQVGNELTVIEEEKTINGFVKIKTEVLKINEVKIDWELVLPEKKGLYRITIYTPSTIKSSNGQISDGSTKLTKFYIEAS